MASRYFFTDPKELAELFTPENWLTEEQNEWFSAHDKVFDHDNGEYIGTKAIEIFDNDIRKNLVAWACDKDSIYYRTQKCWYRYALTTTQGAKIILMTRFQTGTTRRWDTWMNLHSAEGIGGKWLMEKHADKRVPLFHEKNCRKASKCELAFGRNRY